MSAIENQLAGVTLVGDFNPAIFNPDWLKYRKIITPQEAEQAQIGIIHKEFTQFQVGNLQIESSCENFSIKTSVEPFIKIADVIMGIFGEELKYTPIKAMGINYHAHFKVASRDIQTKLGRALAPLAPWGEWGDKLESEEFEKRGGMANLTMQQNDVSDRKSGRILVTVQPSNLLQPSGTGVFIAINDHYDQTVEDELSAPERCSKLFTPSLERARWILTCLSNYAIGLE
ncbi:hypothetical protein [Acetobacter thailandicus]|uniref:hypothetical protein n=1 Tax=Acetobacter thailandicus TaxID=1502842 RepID=UPI001BA7643E|nr:hypothetical protein [Acetobacter thailandicus]